MENKDYQVVSCELHSELELAIMHKSTLDIRVNNCDMRVIPDDIVVRQAEREGAPKSEFLIGKDVNGQAFEIRLDHIQSWKKL